MSQYRRIGVLAAVGAMLATGSAWSAASGETGDSGDGTQLPPQLSGPPPEIVPIGATPKSLQKEADLARTGVQSSRTTVHSARLVSAEADGLPPQLTGPAPDIVPIGSDPVTTDGGVSTQSTFFSCDQNGLCLWQHINYEGSFWLLDKDAYSWNQWHPVPSAADNRTSSMYNRRAKVTLVSRIFPPTQPDQACLPAQAAYDDLRQYAWASGRNVNDTISGFNFRNVDNC